MILIFMSIMVYAVWIGNLIRRYEYEYFVGTSSILIIVTCVYLYKRGVIGIFRLASYGLLGGYLIGIFVNTGLDFWFRPDQISVFFTTMKNMPLTFLIGFLAYPILLGSWLLGGIVALLARFVLSDN